MRRLIEPRSIAVVGASPRQGSFGERTLANLYAFQGVVYPVNPGYEQICDRRCYPNLRALPEVPDCVIIATPKEAVEQTVAECAALGVGGVIVYASGFAELGSSEALDAQARIIAIARAGGVRLAGPNCSGLLNMHSGATMHFLDGYAGKPLRPGPVAVVSQGGGIGYGLLQAMDRGIPFGYFLACGNASDVDVCDYIDFLIGDDRTRVIVAFMEGLSDGKRLLKVGQRALTADKTIIVCKTGRSAAGAQIARSHTGTMVGSAEAYEAAFRKVGIISRNYLDDVLETATFFAKVGRPRSSGVGVVTTSGSLAVMAADLGGDLGLPLPHPASGTRERLAKVLPSFATISNPLDTTASVLRDLGLFKECVAAMAADSAFCALTIPIPYAQPQAALDRAKFICELAADLDVPICIAWTSEILDGEATRIYEQDPKVAFFRSMRRCFEAVRDWQWREGVRQRSRQHEFDPKFAEARSQVEALLGTARSELRSLTERECKRLLAAYDIPVTRERLCADTEAAVAAARDIGYPVALKIESPDIEHKTDAGVVRLGLVEEAALRQACQEVLQTAQFIQPPPRINGLLVQEMSPSGLEIVVGARYDKQFGSVMVIGLGGIWVELLNDVSVVLPPVSTEDAVTLLRNLRGRRLLDGFRGSPSIDVSALGSLISRISKFIVDLGDNFSEMDINPIVVTGFNAMVVDALIVPSGLEATSKTKG
ncbi:acetate--CoA ligase family protein [Ramlibacter lithotrophicus]|nr:acetate--CoA ligase family protein [Ramlibacter lithotrophicus]